MYLTAYPVHVMLVNVDGDIDQDNWAFRSSCMTMVFVVTLSLSKGDEEYVVSWFDAPAKVVRRAGKLTMIMDQPVILSSSKDDLSNHTIHISSHN